MATAFIRSRLSRHNASNNRRPRWGWALGGLAVLAACWGVRYSRTADVASAQDSRATRASGQASGKSTGRRVDGKRDNAASARPTKLATVARVNRQSIHRDQLAQSCLVRFGEEVLESLVNKLLIAQACRERNIAITDQEVQQEIERMSSRFRLGKDEWLKMLEKERGINSEKYSRDIIWPTLALRKLAAERLKVQGVEVREAYESEFGPAVRARLIAVGDETKARSLHQQLAARPADFAQLARQHSQDVSSASLGGMIQPIRKHTGDEQIEQVVFNMREGEISPIVRVGAQFVILKCEGHIPARNVAIEHVQDRLVQSIRDRKEREAAGELFQQLQASATIQNIWNDPERRKSLPGVAAIVSGRQISIEQLAEECIARHGKDVLESQIDQLVLRQALQRNGLTITQGELDQEISHAAELAGVIDSEGRPDVATWMKMVTEGPNVTRDIYIQDAVWPSAALKKLTEGKVTITQEDLDKGFQSNYGPRVRCRAIVMSNLRRAQEVWDKARQNPTVDYFGDLAEQYSIEASSRALRGEVPPIRKFSGSPVLEQEAFNLGPDNPLSGVTQVGDRFVILFFEEYTEPVAVAFDEVKDLLHRDLYEKKLRLAMSRTFDSIKESAEIDNYLAGTSQSTRRTAAGAAPPPTKGIVPQANGAPRRASRPATAARN